MIELSQVCAFTAQTAEQRVRPRDSRARRGRPATDFCLAQVRISRKNYISFRSS